MSQTKSKVFSDVQIWLQVFTDSCGNYQYQQQFQNRNSGILSVDPIFRIWVCGSYQGSLDYGWNYTSGQGAVISIATPVYYYGGCGPQVDNYPTSAGNEDYPATYLNF